MVGRPVSNDKRVLFHYCVISFRMKILLCHVIIVITLLLRNNRINSSVAEHRLPGL